MNRCSATGAFSSFALNDFALCIGLTLAFLFCGSAARFRGSAATGLRCRGATAQGYYALTAYERYKNGQNRLYDMTDVAVKSDYDKTEEVQRLAGT